MILSPVNDAEAKPAAQQVWEMLNWGGRLVVTPTDYKTHRLFRRGRTKQDALRFLSGPRAVAMLEQLNPEVALLEDKIRYADHFGALGLPVPRTLAVIGERQNAGDLPTLRGAADIERFISGELDRGEHLVVKQVDGMQGTGVSVLVGITRDYGDARAALSNGDERSIADLARELGNSGMAWMVQQRLRQHEMLDSLNPTSVNTTRLATFRRGDGTVDIAYTVLRIGRSSGQVDGYSAGGVVVRVDPSTGRLAAQGQQKAKHSVGTIDRHPDSGVVFGDLTLPHWDETLDLARRFAAAAGANRYIGWDVAMTPDGPVFIEGNHNWDVQLAQIGSDGLLTDDAVQHLRSEAGIHFDTTRLPRLRPLRAYQLLSGR